MRQAFFEIRYKSKRKDELQNLDEMPIGEVIDRIEKLNIGIAEFWSKSHGWSPQIAAELLSKSRLDWQASLSGSLRIWIRYAPDDLTADELILAWVNLGSLIEGTIKTFLSIYFNDYKNDIDKLKTANAYNHKKKKLIPPDVLTLDVLRKYSNEAGFLDKGSQKLVELVQQRRNAVHAYEDRPIGTGTEFQSALRCYLVMLRAMNNRMPYPDEVYEPREF